MAESPQIVVVGLGYVGLPLAVALSGHGDVVGFDVDAVRISELEAGHDRTSEVDADLLRASRLALTADAARCAGADIYIVTVPTPIDAARRPDLGPLIAASRDRRLDRRLEATDDRLRKHGLSGSDRGYLRTRD